MLRNNYNLGMANIPSMKNTGEKIVTFMIIIKQSHTRNLYFNIVFIIFILNFAPTY